MLTKAYVQKVLYDECEMEVNFFFAKRTLDFFSVKHPEVSGTVFGFEKYAAAKAIRIHVNYPSIGFELAERFPALRCGESHDDSLICKTESDVEAVVLALKALIDALPEKAGDPEAEEFDPSLDGTEAESFVKQRRGQEKYRQRLEAYWHHQCAVTGIAVPEALRASHAKAWTDCATGAERLSRFNGLLLCANLDALFDKYLITFERGGRMIVSAAISQEQRRLLGIDRTISVSLEDGHQPFMAWHRLKFQEAEKTRRSNQSATALPSGAVGAC